MMSEGKNDLAFLNDLENGNYRELAETEVQIEADIWTQEVHEFVVVEVVYYDTENWMVVVVACVEKLALEADCEWRVAEK
jgi:hypothetical protein